MKICLNWKVLAGLAAVGLGVAVVAPNLIGALLPLLVFAACPLSMLLMMWSMRGMQGGRCDTRPGQATGAASKHGAHTEQLTELRSQLAGLQAQQDAIARQIARLEGADTAAVREAEAVARAASERGSTQS